MNEETDDPDSNDNDGWSIGADRGAETMVKISSGKRLPIDKEIDPRGRKCSISRVL
jgi:hypothetical protein